MNRVVRVLLPAFALSSAAAQADGFDVRRYAKQDAAWFSGSEGSGVVANVLSHQTDAGSWPKNTDTGRPRAGGGPAAKGTFDNGATTGELRFLARAATLTGDARCRAAFLRGFDHVLRAQYPTGGWPQSYPPGTGYHRHITFNDDAMRRLLEFLRDCESDAGFTFLDPARRQAARAAFDRGIDCILKSQIRTGGRLTAWCAQHDEVDLAPRPARSYELVSLSGSESAGLLLLLMSLESPSPEAVRAVHAGVRWFESARITGLRETRVDGDKRMVADPTAPPLWARFYEIDTGRPFFCDRDGVKKFSLAEIGPERRNGYSWYGRWGEPVLERYRAWNASRPAPRE
jgi:pectate lyase